MRTWKLSWEISHFYVMYCPIISGAILSVQFLKLIAQTVIFGIYSMQIYNK